MTSLKQTLAQFHLMHSFTHNYAFLVKKSGYMYVAWIRNISIEELDRVTYLDKPAKSHAKRGATLRYKGRQTAAYKLGLERNSLQCIGTAECFDAEYKAWKQEHKGCNTGHYFEYIIARMHNIEWQLNVTDGREAGDLVINGEHWQLKANGGQVATEQQLHTW